MVSAQLDVSVGQALIRLRAYAFGNDRPLAEVAADVVGRRCVSMTAAVEQTRTADDIRDRGPRWRRASPRRVAWHRVPGPRTDRWPSPC